MSAQVATPVGFPPARSRFLPIGSARSIGYASCGVAVRQVAVWMHWCLTLEHIDKSQEVLHVDQTTSLVKRSAPHGPDRTAASPATADRAAQPDRHPHIIGAVWDESVDAGRPDAVRGKRGDGTQLHGGGGMGAAPWAL